MCFQIHILHFPWCHILDPKKKLPRHTEWPLHLCVCVCQRDRERESGAGTKPSTVEQLTQRMMISTTSTIYFWKFTELQYNKLLKENTFCLLKCLNSKLVVPAVDNNVVKLWSTDLSVYDLSTSSKDKHWFRAQTEATCKILYESFTAYLFISPPKLLNYVSSLDGNATMFILPFVITHDRKLTMTLMCKHKFHMWITELQLKHEKYIQIQCHVAWNHPCCEDCQAWECTVPQPLQSSILSSTECCWNLPGC
jgi:hypothetical protein